MKYLILAVLVATLSCFIDAGIYGPDGGYYSWFIGYLSGMCVGFILFTD